MAKRYNKIILVTAPSGAGKTSIIRHLIQKFPQLAFSVSATNRKPRSNETEGVDYYFLSEEDFKSKIHHKEFLEWEMVYEGKYYGTLKKEVERIWSLNKVPILDIDVQGAIHVQQQYPVNTFSLFIQPPSEEELRKRLLLRGSETIDSLQARINKSSFEMSFRSYFQHVVVNNEFAKACREAGEIVKEFLKKEPLEIN